MSKKNLFMSWLVLKAAIVGVLFILLGFNYLFSANFWYNPSLDLTAARRSMPGAGNIDQFDRQSGYNALMLASAAGKADVVDLLIKNGANVNLNADNATGDTALHRACRNVNLGAINVVDILLKNNANPLLKNKQNTTPFSFVSAIILPEDFKKVMNMFIARGVDINYPDNLGLPLLFAVVDRNQIVLLNLLQRDFAHLVDFDSKIIDPKDRREKNISQFAYGKGDIVNNINNMKSVWLRQLSAAINVNAYSPEPFITRDFTPVIVAAIKGNADYLKEAIERNRANLDLPDKIYGGTCLHWACLYNRLKCVEVIVKNKADVNYKNKVGSTPIHCLWGIRDATDRVKVAKFLFDFGANFNAQDENGNTFLHNAVLWADCDFVKLISTEEYFYKRVNFNLKNKANKTAFELAQNFSQDPKYREIAGLLSNYNNINYVGPKDQQAGITALMLACMRGDKAAAEKLIPAGQAAAANIINQKDKNGDTPLHFAVRFRNVDIAKMLIERGAKVDEKNNAGDTALNEVTNIFDKEKRESIVRLLLEKGCGISENKSGESIMHLAVRKNMPDLILFLKQNIGKLEKNKDGKTAYDLAKEMGARGDMRDIINIFESKK